MVNSKVINMINHKLFNNIFLYFILLFPLVIILRSAAINIVTIFISIIFLFFCIKKFKTNLFKNKFIIYLIALLFFVFINTLIHNQSLIQIIKSLGNYRYLILAMAVYITLDSGSNKFKNNLIFFNFFLVIFVGLDIFYQYIFQKDIFGFVPGMCDASGKNCHRYSGVFGNELIGGGYLSQIGLLVFFLLPDLKNYKIYFTPMREFLFIAFLFFAILISGERNALLIFILSICLFYIFQKKFLNLISMLIIFFIISFSLSQKIESINTRFFNPLSSLSNLSMHNENTSVIKKIKDSPWSWHYQAAIELFLERPIIGHGSKSFRVLCKDTDINKRLMKINQSYTVCSSHPHNYLLEFLAEHGLIGAAFFICLIFYITFKLCLIKNYSKKEAKVLLGLGSLLIAIMFPLKPSGSFFTTLNASILFYIIGFYSYYSSKTK
jgi:O-antigen ligase